MFCSLELGERIERAAAELNAEGSRVAVERLGGGFVLPVAGGVACFSEADSPLNKVAGLGFGGVPKDDELDEVERRHAAVGAPVQVELAHLADPGVGERLTARGYRLVGFENVLGRAPHPDDATRPPAPAGIGVRHSAPDELRPWLDAVVGGFAQPDAQGVASHEEFPREVLERAVRDMTAAAAMRRYVATAGGEIAGGASMRTGAGIAQLTGAATLPAYRRRGVQSALLAARLADAAAEGCDLGVVTTQPASKSQQNAERSGFTFLYTRAVLVKA
ncbi:GNAT family N-acetyltransferase [Streptomyces sp. A7024]|uniref:GNAT family N-acetyltransferase n=1 Tax=Streptomyces coryli TaxID=1128680 RepID=A0A6G4TTF9_9ACTN|nr:GNAT family N-acetyltransferase [Streptomyces coryli]